MDDAIGALVPISFFAMIAAIVLVPRYWRSKERQSLQETLKMAIEKGQPLPTEIVESISHDRKPPPSPQRDLRTGIVWLGVAVGIAVFGLAMGYEEPDATYPLLGMSAFPGFIGLAFIAISLLTKSKD
jgi:hypothetical protein